MSERKQKNMFKSGTTTSNTKTALDSAQKPTPLKQNKLKQEVLPARNLMSQFQKLKPTPKKPLQHYKISQDKDVESQISESSELSSQIYIENEAKLDFKEQNYKFQLPKSYIIAMGGLQEAVKQRDNQMNLLNIKFEEQKRKRQVLEQNVKDLHIIQKQLEKTKEELLLQIKFLKEISIREKQNHQNNEKLKNEYQIELAVSKEKLTHQVRQLKRQVDQLEAQKKLVLENNQKIQSQKQKFIQEIQLLKSKEIQSISKFTQTKSNLANEVQRLESQLKKQKQTRLEAEKQITILKNQLSLLAERTVIAQKKELDCILAQKSYLDAVETNMKLRVPLLDVPTANKQNESMLKEQSKTNVKQQRPLEQQKSQDVPKLSFHQKKATEISIMSRDRSTSRMKSNPRPQIVSQYRQLLRYQKESIALNYQLQLLEKSLAGKAAGQGRNELQRSYQKLKREAQQKQLQIRQLKCFLNESKK